MSAENETCVSVPVLVEMSQGGNIGALVVALAAAKKAFPTITKNAKNPHLNSKFADLASLIEATEKPLADHGLVVLQTHGVLGTGVIVYTQLAHAEGGWIRGAQFFGVEPAKGLSIEQVAGKASTYGRRYGYQAILGIAAEPDDDGHVARDSREADRAPRQQQAPPSRPKDTRPYDVQMRAATTLAGLTAVGRALNDDRTVDAAKRESYRAVYADCKEKLSGPRPPPSATPPTAPKSEPKPAADDDLGGRM